MALLKTPANIAVMKKFLNESYMKEVIAGHKKFLFSGLKSVDSITAEHITLLSKQSFLVTYDLELTYKNGLEQSLRLRGNRISADAAYFWKHLYKHAKKEKKSVVPVPWEYFKKEHFMLYQEFPGKTLRDYDHDYFVLKKITPQIAEKLAWIHSLPITKKVTPHTETEERAYWRSVRGKIQRHLPKKPAWLPEALTQINKELIARFSEQRMTLAHNDFQASNLIYDEGRNRIGIIDFGNSTRYTPSHDVATYLVHTAVMTTKHLKKKWIHDLQRSFLTRYLSHLEPRLKTQVLQELPLYEARVAADIIATTAVALKHTKNPYRILIPKILLPVVEQKMKLLSEKNHTIESLLITLRL